jgi:hypothetical protein
MMLNYSHLQANNKPLPVPVLFQDYITAACTWKILHRFTDPLSAPFMESFNGSDLSFEFRDNVYPSKYTKTDSYLCGMMDQISGFPDFEGKLPALTAASFRVCASVGKPFELYCKPGPAHNNIYCFILILLLYHCFI